MGLLERARRLLSAIMTRRPSDPDEAAADGLPDTLRRDLLDRYRAGFDDRVQVLAERLGQGELSPREFIAQMRIEVRTLHIFGMAAGKGGFTNLSAADSEAIERAVREQFRYLERWGRQLEQMSTLNAAQVGNRARLYGGAANETLERAADVAVGLPTLPFYPGKDTECMTNCGCRWRRVKLEGYRNWDCYWVRSKDDSCRTCIAREQMCNPLRVRGGQVMPVAGAELVFRRNKGLGGPRRVRAGG
ncbi:MAG: hypothetical protein OHK0046_46520 [Anaerolineae bacterium]